MALFAQYWINQNLRDLIYVFHRHPLLPLFILKLNWQWYLQSLKFWSRKTSQTDLYCLTHRIFMIRTTRHQYSGPRNPEHLFKTFCETQKMRDIFVVVLGLSFLSLFSLMCHLLLIVCMMHCTKRQYLLSKQIFQFDFYFKVWLAKWGWGQFSI